MTGSNTAFTAMPAVFVSHGSPMIAIETGPFHDALRRFAREHRPGAIVVVSAHWEAGPPVRVTSADHPATIHDFGGFPQELYELRYDAPGEPSLARHIAKTLESAGFPALLDDTRGLDHGAWIPLRIMYPDADVPVVQVSLPSDRAPESLYRLGRSLAPLRDRGVLIVGSGGAVHNLARLDWHNRDAAPHAWAKKFEEWLSAVLVSRDLDALFRYRDIAPGAGLAVPATEHFDPLFVVLGAASETAPVEPIYEGFQYGSLSMRSFAIA